MLKEGNGMIHGVLLLPSLLAVLLVLGEDEGDILSVCVTLMLSREWQDLVNLDRVLDTWLLGPYFSVRDKHPK